MLLNRDYYKMRMSSKKKKNDGIKKWGFIVLLLFMVSCRQNEKSAREGELISKEVIQISIENQSEEVYGIAAKYFLNKAAQGGQIVSRDFVDTPLSKQKYEILLTVDDFKMDIKNENLGTVFGIRQKNGEILTIPMIFEWKAEFGKSYEFVLCGSQEKGYAIQSNNPEIVSDYYKEPLSTSQGL